MSKTQSLPSLVKFVMKINDRHRGKIARGRFSPENPADPVTNLPHIV
ncbi:hypothetical protein [Proteiniclasticum sediminis]|nr:hypothetical protein [Proteiniclasticum sediminis]